MVATIILILNCINIWQQKIVADLINKIQQSHYYCWAVLVITILCLDNIDKSKVNVTWLTQKNIMFKYNAVLATIALIHLWSMFHRSTVTEELILKYVTAKLIDMYLRIPLLLLMSCVHYHLPAE